jgi:tetratricopeptide (TPR) repeat protein
MPITRFALVLLALLPALALAAAPRLEDASKLLRQGQPAAALEKINAYVAANPKEAQGRFIKGLILTELTRYPEAIKVFTDLTEDYPELPEPYNNLAVLYAAQGQYDRAKQSLEMAIRTHPSYATAHENLGDIYAKMASLAYDKALQLDQSNTSAQTKLSMIKDLFGPTRGGETPKAKPPVKVAAKSPATESNPANPGKSNPAGQGEPPEAQAERAKPATQVAPADKPVVAKAKPAARPKDPKGEAQQALQAWVKAWTAKDAAGYLAFYAEDFKLPEGSERPAWEEERRGRLSRPEFIKVELSDISTRVLSRDKVRIRFTQRYESNIVQDKMRKTVIFGWRDGAWKILEEG